MSDSGIVSETNAFGQLATTTAEAAQNAGQIATSLEQASQAATTTAQETAKVAETKP